MARPKASELTERELEIMHVFWKRGVQSVPGFLLRSRRSRPLLQVDSKFKWSTLECMFI